MRFYLVIVLLFSQSALADKLLFVQGYLGHGSNWFDSGIISQLKNRQWNHGGHYVYTQQGAILKTPNQVDYSKNQYFTVELPTEASFQFQSHILGAYLSHLRETWPDEKLTLVGHSAGGVLSRYVMVKNPELKVNSLITISSPHLGSDLAQLAKLLGETPLALFTPLIGAQTFNRSQDLYDDLLPEKPGNFLYWLNRQQHPDAEYISIVRDADAVDGGDLVVPAYSHDMRNVYALKGKARSYIVQGSHSLNSNDGKIIFDLIHEQAVLNLSPQSEFL